MLRVDFRGLVSSITKAAAQIGVTFGSDEMDIHKAVLKLNETTGIPISTIVKNALRVALFEDEEIQETFRAMKGFTGAARLVARKAVS